MNTTDLIQSALARHPQVHRPSRLVTINRMDMVDVAEPHTLERDRTSLDVARDGNNLGLELGKVDACEAEKDALLPLSAAR
jgi:hypothetical protein